MASNTKDDTANYYVGLVLFSVVVPLLFLASWLLVPRGESVRAREDTAAAESAPAPEAPEAAPAADEAEAAPAE